MTKRNERADFVTPLEYYAALLPVRFRSPRHDDSAITAEAGRPVLMRYVDNAAERKRFYEAVLELPWLAPRVRVAVMRTLGRSQRDAEVEYRKGATAVYKLEVDETAARMRANGERPPRGDIRTAAIEKVAERIGMKPEALAKRLQRCRD